MRVVLIPVGVQVCTLRISSPMHSTRSQKVPCRFGERGGYRVRREPNRSQLLET